MLAAITRQWSLSLPDDLHYDPLVAAPVELAVEDLLPRSEIELPVRDRDDDLAPHDLPLVVRVLTRQSPSFTPLARTSASTRSVMFTNSMRSFVWRVMCLVCDFMGC